MGRSRDRGSIRGVLGSIASRVDEWTLVRRGYDTSRAVDGIERDAVGLVSKIRFVLGIILAGLLCVLPGNPYDGHTLRDVIEIPRSLPAARSSAAMLTRVTAGMTRRTRAASSSRDKSAAPSASSNASCDDAPPSS